MKPKCNDPNCISCAFKRNHPHEDRMHLLLALASCVRTTIQADGMCADALRKGKMIAGLLGVESEQVEKAIPYEQIVQRAFTEQISEEISTLNDMQVVIEVCLALLPPDVLVLVKELLVSAVVTVSKEQEIGKDVENGLLNELNHHLEMTLASGRQTLSGDTGEIPHKSNLN